MMPGNFKTYFCSACPRDLHLALIAPCKERILDFYAVDSGFLVCRIWIPDSNRQWDSGFLELYSGFQSPDSGFLSKTLLDSELHKQKFPVFRNPIHGAKSRVGKFPLLKALRSCYCACSAGN